MASSATTRTAASVIHLLLSTVASPLFAITSFPPLFAVTSQVLRDCVPGRLIQEWNRKAVHVLRASVTLPVVLFDHLHSITMQLLASSSRAAFKQCHSKVRTVQFLSCGNALTGALDSHSLLLLLSSTTTSNENCPGPRHCRVPVPQIDFKTFNAVCCRLQAGPMAAGSWWCQCGLLVTMTGTPASLPRTTRAVPTSSPGSSRHT